MTCSGLYCHIPIFQLRVNSRLQHVNSGFLACEILVPQPGIAPGPPALGTWSLSYRTTRKTYSRNVNDTSWSYAMPRSCRDHLEGDCAIPIFNG